MTTTTQFGNICNYKTGETIRPATRQDWDHAQKHGEAHTGTYADPSTGIVVFCDGPSLASARSEYVERATQYDAMLVVRSVEDGFGIQWSDIDMDHLWGRDGRDSITACLHVLAAGHEDQPAATERPAYVFDGKTAPLVYVWPTSEAAAAIVLAFDPSAGQRLSEQAAFDHLEAALGGDDLDAAVVAVRRAYETRPLVDEPTFEDRHAQLQRAHRDIREWEDRTGADRHDLPLTLF